MISIALDTNMIDELAKADFSNMDPRLAAFIEDIDRLKFRVIIPTPVISEVHSADNEFLKQTLIDWDSAFTVANFDAAAAMVAADITKKLKSKALPQKQRWNGKQRIKVDIQIIAIACVQNVEVIYSNDEHFKTIVEQAEVDIRVQNVDDILRKYS